MDVWVGFKLGLLQRKTVLNVYVHVSLWIVFLFLMVEVAGVELLDDVENVNLTLQDPAKLSPEVVISF